MNIEVKRAFVLADWMKAARRCESGEEFLALLEIETARLAKLAELELDLIIAHDQSRLRRFETLSWRLGSVPLGDCYVYPRMGDRFWAVGKVKDVSTKFARMEPFSSRIWQMKLFAALFERLPLIIVMTGMKCEIDDGSHRAIAMFLSGKTDAKAFIGAPGRAG
jgi:hypothetical protein